ncbi:MAG: RluA family pseudouridine synthase [Bacteroidota bacterium]|nr:RluA family pseudouridine synthase [Bacteroidota bacterium]
MDKITVANVIYEDNHLIAIHKPAGVPTQDDPSGDVSLDVLVKQYIKEKYNKPGDVYLGMVHRLDRPVEGLVLFARTSKAASRISALFRERDIQKTYLAIVEHQPPAMSGTLEGYISKDTTLNKSKVFNSQKGDSKLAILDYKHIQEVNGQHLLQVMPKTGRPHQIRAQLAHMGCHIVGDTKYGSKTSFADRSICLLARRLEFIHPVKLTNMEIQSFNPTGRHWLKWSYQGI